VCPTVTSNKCKHAFFGEKIGDFSLPAFALLPTAPHTHALRSGGIGESATPAQRLGGIAGHLKFRLHSTPSTLHPAVHAPPQWVGPTRMCSLRPLPPRTERAHGSARRPALAARHRTRGYQSESTGGRNWIVRLRMRLDIEQNAVCYGTAIIF
jgi:hypothetical protein